DCDGATDDDGVGASTWYRDADGAGYGAAGDATTACAQPAGYVSDDAACDDGATAVNPGAAEACGDGIDNDCDGATDDDGVGSGTWYRDADGDGYGDAGDATSACAQPAGYVSDDADCDDAAAAGNPGAAAACRDGVDNDCNGATDDDGVGAGTW
ncbi:MAG: sialidase, partial [bacterium]|nr:sialidase [bacterium]